MNTTAQLAKHMRDVFFGGNWTTSNLKDNLKDVSWQQATTKVYSFNTIATLVYHITYYVTEVTKVFEGAPLNAKDEYSFSHPPIQSAEDWDNFLNKIWADVEHFVKLIEKLPDSVLGEDFTDKKYGTYFRNLNGIIEHTHYHLGQIVLIKKIVQQQSPLST
jgi:uncharacterized damage-inducible protein DinB